MNIEEILESMTLEEKIDLCEGVDFWRTKPLDRFGLKGLFVCDGPHGLRKQVMNDDGSGVDMLGINKSIPATCFPTAVTSGNSWDLKLIEKVGQAIGEEAKALNIDVVLGPGANIKRNPLCGRNFEYFSEDPYISGKMASGMINGIQKVGTSACIKHFAVNNQEYMRFTSDSVIDERTLREIYLPAFEMAVKEASVDWVMSAYPKQNGIHCSDNAELLDDILRKDWGFEGAVMTDWGGMNDRIEGFRAGCDLVMPGGSDYMKSEVIEAVNKGKLDEKDIDHCVLRILKMMEKIRNKEKGTFDEEAHHEVARQMAESGAVLLKNDGVLPLSGQKVALIGAMADAPRYQGSGSSHIFPTRMVAPHEVMSECLYARGCDEEGHTDESLLKEAAETAAKAEVAVVFAGLPERYESEGFDRDNMKMPEGHVQMIRTVAKANPNTVVVLLCGSAVECPWADEVKAILYMGLGGQAVGEAVSNLLYGKVNPSGKLAESWPLRYEDCACSEYYGTKDALYMEGIYVGYRYYEKAAVPVRWPFGYGLSYTTFEYSDLKVAGNKVTVTVKNTGDRAGHEVVQLYVKAPEGNYRAVRELKGFDKIYLKPGESKEVEFTLNERSFSLWQDGWVVPAGTYQIQVGELTCDIGVEGENINIDPTPWYDEPKGKPCKTDWEKLLGHPYVEKKPKKGEYTMDDTIMEMKDHSLVMKIMYAAVANTIGKGFPKEERNMDNPMYKMLILSSLDGPIRGMQISGGIKGGLFRGLVEMANGHYIRGVMEMMKRS